MIAFIHESMEGQLKIIIVWAAYRISTWQKTRRWRMSQRQSNNNLLQACAPIGANKAITIPNSASALGIK
jgi:hypothetical protein